MPSGRRPVTGRRSRVQAKLAEAEGPLNAIVEAGTASPLDYVIAVALDQLPLVGAALQKAADAVRDQRIRDLERAVRALVAAIGAVQEDFERRLETDGSFAAYFERITASVLEPAQRAKIDYYARLLTKTAAAGGPDEDTRERLLDTLDSLRPRHLRALEALARVPAIEGQGGYGKIDDVWGAMRSASYGVGIDEFRIDYQGLAQLGLVHSLVGDGVVYDGEVEHGLNEYGRQFVRFLIAASEDDSRGAR